MKKDKAVVIESPSTTEADYEDDEQGDAAASNPPARRFSTRNASSKYDFVKVKVWLGDNADHYYVLSRFLLSRMLTVTKIPNHVAIKIALELKKLLVDNSLLDVSQSDLEANLFKLMERRGFGEEYINRYKMITRFHHMRVPLVILVCGTACVGKSTIATQLAQRLNLPNVLQTAMVYELLRTSTDAPLASSPVWARDFSSSEELITEFCRECRIVRKGLAGDLKKAMKDGKPIIIEIIEFELLFMWLCIVNNRKSGNHYVACERDLNDVRSANFPSLTARRRKNLGAGKISTKFFWSVYLRVEGGEGREIGEVPEQIIVESASMEVSEELLPWYAVQAKQYQLHVAINQLEEIKCQSGFAIEKSNNTWVTRSIKDLSNLISELGLINPALLGSKSIRIRVEDRPAAFRIDIFLFSTEQYDLFRKTICFGEPSIG
ncbi:hypothetical protein HAX54_016265 [Datura stramonium]|uniref:P-loop containing nucleoside triphosphate hydrolases superfamily protein n=1 Tax=Datura stramonium TaxID=4076 RepID=A0ABS8RZU8_DATST|nr:hypothetical protein [Datura stramonium]